jgi:hypothetical protein
MSDLAKKIYDKFNLGKLPTWGIFALLAVSALCFYQVYIEINYLIDSAKKGAPCEECSK